MLTPRYFPVRSNLAYALAPVLALTLFLAAPLASAGPGAHGPNGEHLNSPAAGGNGAGLMRLPDGSVNVPKQAQRRMAIRTRFGVDGEHPLTLELNGRVTMDPNAGGLVQAPFAGQLEPAGAGFPVVGQQVKRGQPLARIRPLASAVDRGNQQAQLADIRANLQLARQRVERLTTLADTVPRKDLEAARAELASLGGRERAIAGSVQGSETVTASASGVIARANVLAGQAVDARELLFEIIDPQRLTVEAQSTDVMAAAAIEKATLRDLPGVSLSFLGTGRSMRDGALPVAFRAQSAQSVLAVGQPVTVIAQLKQRVKGIVLPAQAVVRNPVNETVVWIKSGAERFVPQPVEVRALDAKTVVVIKGLAADNRVVTAGAALINQIR